MATLSGMLQSMEGYSMHITQMMGRTDIVVRKMMTQVRAFELIDDSAANAGEGLKKAAKGTQSLDTKLDKMKKKTEQAAAGLKKLAGEVVNMDNMQTVMKYTDAYINTKTRLTTANDGSQSTAELQEKVFAAANRSRGSYGEMASTVAGLSLTGGSFTSNDEAIGFVELLQKSVKMSGAGDSGQQFVFSQVTQAMTEGGLQESGLTAIMENAPLAAQAVADYMGATTDELPALAAEGAITADVLKNALFAAAGEINGKFSELPVTCSDVWSNIKNGAMEAFGDVFEQVNGLLNSDMGQTAISSMVGLLHMAAEGAGVLLDGIGWIVDNMDIFGPILLGTAAAWAVYNTNAGIAWLTTLKHVAAMALKAVADGAETVAIVALIWAQEGFNAALAACPMTWIIAAIILLIAAFYGIVAAVNHAAGSSISATGLIGAAFFTLMAFMYNTFIYPVHMAFAMLANFLGNVFHNKTAAVKILFLDMANACIGYALNMANALETVINKIPGVSIDITSNLEKFREGLGKTIDQIKDESGWEEYVEQPEVWDYTSAASSGYGAGSYLEDKMSDFMKGFLPGDSEDDMSKYLSEYTPKENVYEDNFATTSNPAAVKGTGAGGAVKVENVEDIQWLRTLAERDYVARIAQNTLAPSIKVEFSGPITKEADTDRVMSHVAEQLKGIMAAAPEGVPA